MSSGENYFGSAGPSNDHGSSIQSSSDLDGNMNATTFDTLTTTTGSPSAVLGGDGYTDTSEPLAVPLPPQCYPPPQAILLFLSKL